MCVACVLVCVGTDVCVVWRSSMNREILTGMQTGAQALSQIHNDMCVCCWDAGRSSVQTSFRRLPCDAMRIAPL